MEDREPILIENWLTRKPNRVGYWVAMGMAFLVLFGSALNWGDLFFAKSWIAANPKFVFGEHQFFRLWTTLFAHSNMEHLLGNGILLFPLTYLLSAHYQPLTLPLLSLFAGGLVNYFVLQTLPQQTYLIGISGVVYLMGSLWMTLSFLIDRRQGWRKRFAKILFLTVVLFVPETFKPEISYLSHLLGFLIGILLALIFYQFKRKEFKAAEVWWKPPSEETSAASSN